jgi:hypothetical protein
MLTVGNYVQMKAFTRLFADHSPQVTSSGLLLTFKLPLLGKKK